MKFDGSFKDDYWFGKGKKYKQDGSLEEETEFVDLPIQNDLEVVENDRLLYLYTWSVYWS